MDTLTPWLDRIGGPRVAIGILVALVVLYLVVKLLNRPKASSHVETKRCPRCGWTGSVSRYKPVCPRCATPIP